jgi:hypothetical protein
VIRRIVFIGVFACALVVYLSAQATTRQESGRTSGNHDQVQDETQKGERLFQVHCGRCHTPPETLPPAVAKTVLRHMRVRAMLSKEDEKAILEYIAP